MPSIVAACIGLYLRSPGNWFERFFSPDKRWNELRSQKNVNIVSEIISGVLKNLWGNMLVEQCFNERKHSIYLEHHPLNSHVPQK